MVLPNCNTRLLVYSKEQSAPSAWKLTAVRVENCITIHLTFTPLNFTSLYPLHSTLLHSIYSSLSTPFYCTPHYHFTHFTLLYLTYNFVYSTPLYSSLPVCKKHMYHSTTRPCRISLPTRNTLMEADLSLLTRSLTRPC